MGKHIYDVLQKHWNSNTLDNPAITWYLIENKTGTNESLSNNMLNVV